MHSIYFNSDELMLSNGIIQRLRHYSGICKYWLTIIIRAYSKLDFGKKV